MHRIDDSDLAHAARLGLDVVAALPCPLDEAGRINPQVTRLALTNGQWADVVHVKPVYYQHASGAWRPLSEVCEHHGNRRISIRPDRVSWVHPAFLVWLMRRQRLLGSELVFGGPEYTGLQPCHLAFASTLTAYPDPDPETTTVDGEVIILDFSGWASAQAAADGSASDDSSTTMSAISRDIGFGAGINRAFALFNTASLTAGATISAAVLSLYATTTANDDNDADDWINILQSSPAANTSLSTADFDQCGAVTSPTEGATRIDIGSITTSAYNDFTLNATGRGWVNKSGATKLGAREGHDCINSAIAASASNSVTVATAEAGGTSTDPKLVVTYTPPAGAGLLRDPLRAFIPLLLR